MRGDHSSVRSQRRDHWTSRLRRDLSVLLRSHDRRARVLLRSREREVRRHCASEQGGLMRKTAIFVVEDEGRDLGKTFVLREMPAAVAERWATRALLTLARSGVQLPDDIEKAGWAGMALMGFQALSQARFEEIQPLLDEMWQCVSFRSDPRHPDVLRPLFWGNPDGEGADIDEVATMLRLRAEIFNLHAGFSLPGVGSTSSISTISTSGDSPSTRTPSASTAGRSPRRSPPGRRR